MSVDAKFLGYIAFAFVLAATPGSTTAVVVRNTLGRGRWSGIATALGAVAGNASQATAAGLGLALVLSKVPSVTTVMRVLGALYLAWLGANSLWQAALRRHRKDIFANQENQPPRRASFRQGLTVNLLNPPVSTFYLVVVPSFIPPTAPRWYFAFLAFIHITIAFMCHTAWAMAFHQVRHIFQVPSARRLLEGAIGVALLVLAARILWNQ